MTRHPLCRSICHILAGLVLCATSARLDAADWPDVLVIDDFEGGAQKWTHDDAGSLSITNSAPQGGQALVWTAGDDGLGHIVYTNLSRERIDFSQYDTLMMWVRVEGKPIWNINPIIQQYPAVYGFRGLYYSIDTLHPFGEWFLFTQDLSRWENAWPDTFSREKQEFSFEITQLAGSGATRVYLDDIRLLRNPVGLKPSYPGEWSQSPDGAQTTTFKIQLRNGSATNLTIRVAAAPATGAAGQLQVQWPTEPLLVATGEDAELPVTVLATPDLLQRVAPWYGETIRVAVRADEIPGLVLFTELSAGTRPAALTHPCLICGPERMRELHLQYGDTEKRAGLDKDLLNMVAAGEKALSFEAQFPPLAATGRTRDPVSGAKLVEIDVPNLPFHVYQDPESGRSYSGPLYDAGMQGYLNQHMGNAATAQQLGMAYLVSGRREFAEAAARILLGYTNRYLALPITVIGPASPVGSATSGSTRIGGTFMRERVWLSRLAVALDCIRPAGVVSEAQVQALADKVFQPSADNMMDHKVGVMNLQWMIQGASLLAGLAADIPAVAARAVHSSHGILRLMDTGFLEDGNWWENPSYQNVTRIAAFPALCVAIHNGLIPWSDHMQVILKAAYLLHGPDGKSPTLGTGGYAGFPMNDVTVAMFSKFIDDPSLAWVCMNRKRWGGTYGLDSYAKLRWEPPSVPEADMVSPITDKTVLFPDYGGIALRVPGTDAYCYMHYGRELTHGHRNKLSFHGYGQGKWYARNVMGGYGDAFKTFLETVASANTVVVDEMNADQDTGELLFHAETDESAIACAREVGAWKDAEHERAVILTERLLIVVDRLSSDTPHTYDWLYHANRTGLLFDSLDKLQGQTNALGGSAMYAELQNKGVLPAFDSLNWRREDGSGLSTAFHDGGQMHLINVHQKRYVHEGLLWRKHGKTVGFAAAFMARAAGDDNGPVTIESLPLQDPDGQRVGIESGQAFQVKHPAGTCTVVVNYTGHELSCGKLKTQDRTACLVQRADKP